MKKFKVGDKIRITDLSKINIKQTLNRISKGRVYTIKSITNSSSDDNFYSICIEGNDLMNFFIYPDEFEGIELVKEEEESDQFSIDITYTINYTDDEGNNIELSFNKENIKELRQKLNELKL